MLTSPYASTTSDQWALITADLINKFPLDESEVVSAVLEAWDSLLHTRIGSANYQIGKDIFPQPQIMGFFLHELIPLELEHKYPAVWSRDLTGYGKDLICRTDSFFDCEIKTSSDKMNVFGNRSHAQLGSTSKKDKSGYYITVNFGKFVQVDSSRQPIIHRIRLGWLDSADWLGQTSQTGQQARISSEANKHKLKELYRVK